MQRFFENDAIFRRRSLLKCVFCDQVDGFTAPHFSGMGSANERLAVTPPRIKESSMYTILLVLLVLLLLGAIPAWPHSRSWGYAPSGGLGLILIILLILVLAGRI